MAESDGTALIKAVGYGSAGANGGDRITIPIPGTSLPSHRDNADFADFDGEAKWQEPGVVGLGTDILPPAQLDLVNLGITVSMQIGRTIGIPGATLSVGNFRVWAVATITHGAGYASLRSYNNNYYIGGPNMGIVADLQNSTFDSQTPKNSIPMGAISNIFICVMHAFQISFSFRFDPDPKRGIGGSPASRQLWEIGVVQNVLYEMMNFRYSDGSNFRVEFPQQVLDSVAAIHPPFYNDPVFVKGCDIDPILKCDRYIPIMVPVVDIWYTSRGYGELLDWGAYFSSRLQRLETPRK